MDKDTVWSVLHQVVIVCLFYFFFGGGVEGWQLVRTVGDLFVPVTPGVPPPITVKFITCVYVYI